MPFDVCICLICAKQANDDVRPRLRDRPEASRVARETAPGIAGGAGGSRETALADAAQEVPHEAAGGAGGSWETALARAEQDLAMAEAPDEAMAEAPDEAMDDAQLELVYNDIVGLEDPWLLLFGHSEEFSAKDWPI
jgi:hypothetical protein